MPLQPHYTLNQPPLVLLYRPPQSQNQIPGSHTQLLPVLSSLIFMPGNRPEPRKPSSNTYPVFLSSSINNQLQYSTFLTINLSKTTLPKPHHNLTPISTQVSSSYNPHTCPTTHSTNPTLLSHFSYIPSDAHKKRTLQKFAHTSIQP